MSDELEPGTVKVRAYQAGGRVRETGLALVHEGEYIVPAEGSEAEIEAGGPSGGAVVNYYFPVEIVVVGSLPLEEREAIIAQVWEQLGSALERSG
jgi:hypothetical protein